MKRASSQTGAAAGSSVPAAAKRSRTDPSASDPSFAKIVQALEAVPPGAGASFDSDALAKSFDLQQAARKDWENLGRELRALEGLEAEVTVLNINAAMLLEKKAFSLPTVEPVGGWAWGESPTVGSVLRAIWTRVDQLVQQCKYEEGRAAANAEGGKLPVLDEGERRKLRSLQGQWTDLCRVFFFLNRATERGAYSRPRLPEWIEREWTVVAGADREQPSVSLELLPATKGVYRLAGCDIDGGGEIIAILVADRSEVDTLVGRSDPEDAPVGGSGREAPAGGFAPPEDEDLLLPTSSFLSRAALNVVFGVRMSGQGHWYKVYAGDLRGVRGLRDISKREWLSTFPGQEQYESQRKKDMAATHERFPGAELSEAREKLLNERDRHRLAWKVSPGNNKPEAYVLSLSDRPTSQPGIDDPEEVDELLELLQSVEKATTPVPDDSTTGATDWPLSGLFLRAEKEAKAREDARVVFLQRLEKNTNPEAGLAPLVKSRLNEEARGNIMLVPDGGDPAGAEPCRPEDRLLDLLTSKSADGSARGGWKWLEPGRVEMQFYAMMQ